MKYLILVFVMGISGYAHATEIANPKSIFQLDQQWTNQEDKKKEMKQLGGAPQVVTMIFTSCPGACPLMVSDMKSFDMQLTKKEKSKIKFAAFSIDPANDHPKELKAFYNKMKLDKRWSILTSNADQVRELAAILGFGYKDVGDGTFTHSSTLFLLSADGEILARKERNSDWKEFLEKFRAELKKSK
ncbi:MAG: SCO family protein [Pseudobdellovibrio sp.]